MSSVSPPTAANSNQESLAAKLGDCLTSARSDLEINRQLMDGQPVYIVHDPQSFQSHRFSLADYRILCALSDERPLAQVFDGLVRAGDIQKSQEDDFYRFIVALRMLNLLKSTESCSKELYEKYRKTEKAPKQGGLMRLMSIKIPLVNPDAFLTNTMPIAALLFSPAFFVIWLIAGGLALLTLLRRAADFAEPLNGVLAAGNIPFFLFTLVGLKVWHELGHGYACKKFGGRVPEMGTILMMGMPLAYVDASATWNFPKRYQRLIVMLGGMYFESILAIVAVFIWAVAGHSLLGSCAYQTILTASVVTVLFNANPLMRYDGYFVLTELIRMPNLRQIATNEMKRLGKRLFLGVAGKVPEDISPAKRWVALVYAVASGIYSNMLPFGIAAVLAYKLPQFGLVIASYYLYQTLGKKVVALAGYLRKSEDAKRATWRSKLTLAGAFVVLPLIVAILPAPTGHMIAGVVTAQQEDRVRVRSAGIFAKPLVRPGQYVSSGTPLVALENQIVETELRVSHADLKHWTMVRDSFVEEDRVKFAQLTHAVNRAEHQRDDRAKRLADLTIMSPSEGTVATLLRDDQLGRMVEPGEVAATIVGGRPKLRCYLNEEQYLETGIKPGLKVSFCLAGRSSERHSGVVSVCGPATVTSIEDRALTQAGGESILLDQASGKPLDNLYLVEIDCEGIEDCLQEYGRRVSIRFAGSYEPVAWYLVRKIHDFSRKLDSQQ